MMILIGIKDEPPALEIGSKKKKKKDQVACITLQLLWLVACVACNMWSRDISHVF